MFHKGEYTLVMQSYCVLCLLDMHSFEATKGVQTFPRHSGLPAGSDLLLLDPYARYLPDGHESLEAELCDRGVPHFKAATEEWPGSIAPFASAISACAGVMPALQLPEARIEAAAAVGSAGDDNSGGSGSGSSSGAAASDFPGTLFRLPLRSEAAAAASEVCQTAGSVSEVEQLVRGFAEAAPSMLLFTRHVRKISVLLIEPGATSATTIAQPVHGQPEAAAATGSRQHREPAAGGRFQPSPQRRQQWQPPHSGAWCLAQGSRRQPG